MVLAGIAKWEIRVRSGSHEQTAKIEGRKRLEGKILTFPGGLQIPPLRFAPVGMTKGRGVTHLESCYSDGQSF